MSARASAIRVLSRQLADQIAAGEVVERPASVVKELVENSLDAGATRIEVEAEQGGVRLVRVRDDGYGIARDELALALARHATSKIGCFEDLQRVSSLGFRGEALPSIASVSRLELASRLRDVDGGWCLRVTGGESPAPPAPCPHEAGTTVTVRDLFYNTPARRKFLRTERTELRHLEDVLKRAALSRFDTAFSLRHNARQVFAVGVAADEAARTRRIARLCGREFVASSLAIDFESTGLRLWGWIGRAPYSRASTDLQHFFVNSRVVLDPMLRHAVRQACHERIAAGRHPAYVLYLELDADAVDVNVHPTKHEVRFRDARSVHDFVVRSLGAALVEGAHADASGPLAARDTARARQLPASGPGRDVTAAQRPRADASFYRSLAEAGASAVALAEPGAEAAPAALGQALALIAGRYLLARAADGLVLVDAAAACRELARRRLLAAFETGSAPSRPLLVPVGVEVGEHGADALEREATLLARLGFDLRRVAPGTVSCRQVPVSLGAEMSREALHALAQGVRMLDAGPGRDDVMAARALVEAMLSHCDMSAGRQWRADDMNALLAELEAIDDGAAPAGAEPLWVRLGVAELEALLRRRGTP